MYALQSVAIKNTVPLAEAQAHYKKITKKKPSKVREEGEWWRFRYMPPTRFKKGTFRTKVVNDDIHLIFGELEGTHAKLEGRGLFDYFTKAYDYVSNKASDAFSYVKNAISITDYSASTKKLLAEYGKNEIIRMTIRRVPISFAIDLALQGVSAGKWEELKKKYGFDKFFHLSLIVYLKNAWEKTALRKGRKIPKQLSLEKLEVVSVNERVEPVEGQEEQEVPIPQGQKITIDGMFDKTRQRMGDTRFFSYSALGQNNCQDFVSNLLQSEGLYREPEKEFVFQDVSELAKELPATTLAISQGYTHLSALANKYLGVGGAKNEIIIPKKDFVKEHTHLIGLLKKSDDPALQKEADIQEKELKGELEGGTHRENVLKRYKLEDKGYSLSELASISGVPEKILQEVYNRGIGAYKTQPKSVRLKGSFVKNVDAPASKKLSKEAWAFARIYSFLDGGKHDEDLRENKSGGGVFSSRQKTEEEIAKERSDEIDRYLALLNELRRADLPKARSDAIDRELAYWDALKRADLPNPDVRAYTGNQYPPNQFSPEIESKPGVVKVLKKKGGAKIGLNELLNLEGMYQVGGTKNSGFIRAMMARDKAKAEGADVNTVENKKKFKYLDKKGFKLQKLTKTTHDLVKKKKMSQKEKQKAFYDYVIANAPAHKPDWDGGIHYGDTYDLDELFTQWNKSQGEEKREERQAKREEPEQEIDLGNIFRPDTPLEQLAREYNTITRVRGLRKDDARALLRRFGGNPRVPNSKDYRLLAEVQREIVEYANRILQRSLSGGTASSGFIQAMMGRESKNPAVQAKFQQRIEDHNEKVEKKQAKGDKRVTKGKVSKEYLNKQKFKSSSITKHDGFDINEMSKATHDLMRHKKLLTVDEAIKRFYDFLKKHAPQHIPKSERDKMGVLINYRGAYDIPGMFDRFTEEEGVKVADEDDGKYDEPEPEKYKELSDLIRQSNEDRVGKNFTDKEIERMVHLFRYYKLDDDAPDLPEMTSTTQKRLNSLRFMTDKERRGEDLTLEDLKEIERKEGDTLKRNEKLKEDMKKQEEKNKRYRIEEAKAKRGEKPSDEFIHTVLGTIYREALKAKEKK